MEMRSCSRGDNRLVSAPQSLKMHRFDNSDLKEEGGENGVSLWSCCGSYLAELESTDLCNDDFASNHHHHPQGYKDISSSYANGSRSADFRSPGLGSAPETPQGKFYAVEPSQMLQDIAANKNTKMLAELLIKVEQMSRDIQFIKTEIAYTLLTLRFF
ncbi:uncharacterized protein KZ484_026874 [Pholidichthys leucotaenia]